MTETTLTKICTKCKVEKPYSEYHKDKTKPNGIYPQCKACRSRYGKDNREAIRIREKIYREANKDAIAAVSKKRYQANKKAYNAESRAYYMSHKESIAARRKEYYQENRDAIVAQKKLYREENEEKIKAQQDKYVKSETGKARKNKSNQRRRALKLMVSVEDFLPTEVFERDGYRCQMCGRKTRPDFKDRNNPLYPNLDHIIPLSLGGDHSKTNCQCLCRKCNITKGNTGAGDQLRMFG